MDEAAASDTPENSDEVEASVNWQAYVPTDVADHLATMARAARDSNCGVPWQLLASIARVESNFGRNMATSSAGAVGYGQFLPSSWQAYGNAGNVYDYRDALPAIALYLCQSGLDRDPRTALYAYNHADWYVDMVLDLAVRFDRMAPGAPTPDVLAVSPSQQDAAPMRYADGRDLRLQNRARTSGGAVQWLGVPWRGRTAGQSISAAALDTTTLAMLRLNVGGRGDVPAMTDAGGSDNLGTLSDAAWDAGLLALPGAGPQWTTSELRQHLSLGQPVVVFVGSRGLPGHPPDEDIGEQPLLLIGSSQSGFVYSDPTFASSLGYGLQISETDLQSAWDAATRPRQALAFVPRPRTPTLLAHLAEATPPDTIARVVITPTPAPVVVQPTEAPTSVPPTRTASAALPARTGRQHDVGAHRGNSRAAGRVVPARGLVVDGVARPRRHQRGDALGQGVARSSSALTLESRSSMPATMRPAMPTMRPPTLAPPTWARP